MIYKPLSKYIISWSVSIILLRCISFQEWTAVMFLSCGGLAETDDETEFVGQLELALKENQGNLHALAKLLNTVMPDEGNSRSGH